MILPDKYTLIQKDIKHARIRVSEDGQVRVIIPNNFTEDDVQSLLKKKARWVASKKSYFSKKLKIKLGRNQLLLFGQRYNYFFDHELKRKIIIDHEFGTIRSSKDILDINVQEKWYKQEAKNYLIPRTEYLAKNLSFKYNKIYIRSQRTKIGSCSEKKNISLNWRLIKAPKLVIDYIIVHELVHTRVMNHSRKFWTMLRSHFPDYKQANNWLDKYGNNL